MREQISPRMSEVLRLAANGKTDKEIALILGISAHTVTTHWKRLRRHFDATSRTEVVAKVTAKEAAGQSKLDQEERDRLLFEIAERERAELKLQEVVKELNETIKERNELIANAYKSRENANRDLVNRIAELETLNRIMRDFGCIANEGKHGASWTKDWVSEVIEIHGYNVKDVVDGTVTVFDTLHPEDLPDSLSECAAALPTGGNILLAHRFISKNGETRVLLDFLKLAPADPNGIGKMVGFAIDITDWLPLIKDKIDRGWPDLPLRRKAA